MNLHNYIGMFAGPLYKNVHKTLLKNTVVLLAQYLKKHGGDFLSSIFKNL